MSDPFQTPAMKSLAFAVKAAKTDKESAVESPDALRLIEFAHNLMDGLGHKDGYWNFVKHPEMDTFIKFDDPPRALFDVLVTIEIGSADRSVIMTLGLRRSPYSFTINHFNKAKKRMGYPEVLCQLADPDNLIPTKETIDLATAMRDKFIKDDILSKP